MTKYSNADNLFGLSPYICDPTNPQYYNSIQTAINDASAAGGGKVFLRPGVYTEDLLWLSGVDLIGVTVDGRVFAAPAGELVLIRGAVTIADGNERSGRNILFINAAGPTFTMTNGAGTVLLLTLINCAVRSGTAQGILSTPSPANAINITIHACDFRTNGACIAASVDGLVIVDELTNLNSAAECIGITDAVSLSVYGASMTASTYGLVWDSSGTCGIVVTGIVSTLEAIRIVSGSVSAETLSILCSAASGFWVTGPGSLLYADIINSGTAIGIDPIVIQNILDWQPYAQSAVAPATPTVPAVRGTCCFDNTQFTVTDGFVQLSSPSSIAWTDQPAPITVTSNSGSFITNPVALTLPAAPTQGNVCEFVALATPGSIFANAGQTIAIGSTLSSIGGSAASTGANDSLVLVFRAADNTWYSVPGSEGNWILV